MKRTGWFLGLVIIIAIGILGYMSSGEQFIDAAYCTLGLFFVNPISDSTNVFINIARWCSPILTASGIIILAQTFAKNIRDSFVLLRRNTTVIYSKTESAKELSKKMKNTVVSENTKFLKADDYIVMMEDDYENLKFCSENKEKLSKKRVFVELSEFDSLLLKDSRIVYFSINDIVARNLWKREDIKQEFLKSNREMNVAIVGESNLTKNILKQALLHNIYSVNQSITYYVYSNEIIRNRYGDLELMNNDSIEFCDRNQESLKMLSKSSIIILCDDNDLETMQYLLSYCNNSKLYFFCKKNVELSELFKNKNYYVFGNSDEVVTEDNIKFDATYKKAIELNYAYEKQYNMSLNTSDNNIKKQLWEELDGFTKGSNIASTDYDEIRVSVEKELKPSDKDMAVMEHIRWSRYHFIAGWKYGISNTGNAKDSELKIHNCLVDFNELLEVDQRKDYESVNKLRELR